MPYIIKNIDDGFKVCKKNNQKKCFSKLPLTLETAKRQLKAIGMSGRGTANEFEKQLNLIGLTPKEYLNFAKFVAKNRNYEPELLELSNNPKKKLMYDNIHFGKVGYNDKIIYAWKELNNLVEKGTTQKKMINYRKRAKDIKNNSPSNSPARLAFNIIW